MIAHQNVNTQQESTSLKKESTWCDRQESKQYDAMCERLIDMCVRRL